MVLGEEGIAVFDYWVADIGHSVSGPRLPMYVSDLIFILFMASLKDVLEM